MDKASAIIDISLPLHPNLPKWPDSGEVKILRLKRLETRDAVNISKLETGLHAGTHVDAPRHYIADGKTVDELPLDLLMAQLW